MATNDLFKIYPRQRLTTQDGMAVTAALWETAHEYHRERIRAHELVHHGWGIVAGLHVHAKQPADSFVRIEPGVAINQLGQTYVLDQVYDHDLRTETGILYIILDEYQENLIPLTAQQPTDAPQYSVAGYKVKTVKALPATSSYIELARLHRVSSTDRIVDASDLDYPARNQLDLRFRREIGVAHRETMLIGVKLLDGIQDNEHSLGMDNLARTIRYTGTRYVNVEHSIDLAQLTEQYTLLYLVGKDRFDFPSNIVDRLANYLRNGGTIFYESCRKNVKQGDTEGDKAFFELVRKWNINLEQVQIGHPLLRTPHLFAEPPLGFEDGQKARIFAGGGVVAGYADYGCLWQGRQRTSSLADRNHIRNAFEWGENLMHFADQRRQRKIS